MKFSPALVLDAVLVLAILASVIYYVRKGFAAGLISLCGNLAALAAAWFVSGRLSPALFDNFFKSGLIAKTTDMLARQGSVSISGLLDGLAGIVPQKMLADLSGKATALLTSGAPDAAQKVVEDVIAPLVVPLITVLLFFAVFVLCRLLISFLTTVLANLNKVPVLGGVNRALGALTGLAAGVLNVLLILCLLWAVVVITGGKLPFFNETTLSGSYFYTFFSAMNPFVKA